MKNGTAWGRSAAEAALAGPDEVVLGYLRNGWITAAQQDERSYVERLAEESSDKAVRDAAEVALDGDAAAVSAFVANGRHQAGAEGMRVDIAKVIDGAGPVLAEAGRAALATGDPKKYSEFLGATQQEARTQDERVKAAQLVDSGTPEVKSAARIALAGSPDALHAFVVSGQYKALRKDKLTATHVAQVRKMIADAAKVAATAQENAATAQKVAATARNAAAEATEWAKKANESAGKAQEYADQADRYADQAEASAAEAAASAKTARNAANSADAAASRAARSAADATISAESAQASASTAAYYAEEARKSEIAAGKDADAALEASTKAFLASVAKFREEEEERRKAAVAAKEAAENQGMTPAELYRCQQSILPCDPVDFARWCQHNQVYCSLLAHADEFSDAAEMLWNIEKELLGISDLEECLREKDFDSCSGLAVGVLSGKLKVLDRAYDELKLLKRGCKILDKAPLTTVSRASFTTTAAAASGGVPCGEHKVPGLPLALDEIANSGGCDVCAEKIRKSLGGGDIVTIRPVDEAILPKYRGVDAGWFFHVVVVYNGRVYDAWTGRGGDTIADYKAQWTRHHIIDFGF
jgi:hypothetical protein